MYLSPLPPRKGVKKLPVRLTRSIMEGEPLPAPVDPFARYRRFADFLVAAAIAGPLLVAAFHIARWSAL